MNNQQRLRIYEQFFHKINLHCITMNNEKIKDAIGLIGSERTENDPERDTNQVMKHLNEIAELEHQAVIDLMAGSSRFGMIEL